MATVTRQAEKAATAHYDTCGICGEGGLCETGLAIWRSGELIDIQAANTEVRERMKADLARKYADVCGAVNATAFEYAVHGYTQELIEIERKGWCLAGCGPLVGESLCVHCGRDNG